MKTQYNHEFNTNNPIPITKRTIKFNSDKLPLTIKIIPGKATKTTRNTTEKEITNYEII